MKNYFILLIVLLILPNLARASFVITEIMYDLDGKDAESEWIEIKNQSDKAVNLTDWFVFSDNTKHKLVTQGESTVLPGNYAIIAQNDLSFQKSWPNYKGLLFDSSWTDFNNTAETISIMNDEQKIIDTLTYTSTFGAKGNGYSLQKIDDTWEEANPTPGNENILILNQKPTTNIKKTENIKKEEFLRKIEDNEKSTISNEVINLNQLSENNKKNIEWPGLRRFFPYIDLSIVILLGFVSILLIRVYEKDSLKNDLSVDDIKIIE